VRRAVLGSGIIIGIVAGATAATAALGLFESRACTLAGCSDGIRVAVRVPSEPTDVSFARACALGKCTSPEKLPRRGSRLPIGFLVLPCPKLTEETTAELSVVLLDHDHQRLSRASKEIEINTFQPNGPECEPTCDMGRAGFDAATNNFVGLESVFDK
jgi:hypothetical protein